MDFLNTVNTSVTVAGKGIHFVKLRLEQKFNQHHYCEVLVDYENLDTLWMNDPIKIIKHIGEPISVTMTHRQNGGSNVFNGIITNVTMVGNHGAQNQILIQASSPTISLGGKPTMDSFTDKTLESIVSEAAKTSGNGAELSISPKYDRPIEYICQHNENAFEFFNRLSYLYGEAFFYDGSTTYFGLPQLNEAIPITYDVEMTSYNLEANLQSSHFKRYDYLIPDDDERSKVTNIDSPKTTGYLKASLDRSQSIYTSDSVSQVKANVDNPDSIQTMVNIERNRDITNMLRLSGKTQTCKIKLGRVITVDFPNSMDVSTSPGNFIVTEVVHIVDQEGHYSNNFSGVSAALEQIPEPEIRPLMASRQRATVLSNADPDGWGRVQIQFQWQKYTNKNTNWIRVQTPDAGTGARGYIFIPEIGDEVMIDFENSDPSKPFVSGSLFPVSSARGGLEDNHLKSITTRSGHTIVFNDDTEAAWGITIKDAVGNIIHLDTKGKNIEITAPETIKIKAKNIEIEVEEDIKTKVGRDIDTEVGQDAISKIKRDIQQDSGRDTIIASSKNINVTANNELDIFGKQKFIGYSDGNVEFGAKSQMHVYGANSLITAKNDIAYKAPKMNEAPQSGNFDYDREPKIVATRWLNAETDEEVDTIFAEEDYILELQTRNHEEGDSISIDVVNPDESLDAIKGNKKITYTGNVESDGFVRIKINYKDEQVPDYNEFLSNI